jgi:twinkle protein
MWYKGKFFLYDAKDFVTQDKILDVFEYAYQRYGCCVFMIDNLMSLALDTDNEKDFYRKQAKFIGKCKAFTEKYNIHIHVVAHPRKTQTGEVTKQDIAGSSDIANWADNVIRIKRYTQKELSKLQDKEEFRLLNISSSLEIQKNRFRGKQDIEVLLGFDENSKRLYPAKSGNFNWQYGWITGIGQKPTIEQFAEWEAYGTVIDCE